MTDIPWLRRLFGVREYEPYRWQELADYNNRLSKGIVHTPGYVERMALEQARFHVEQRARWAADPNAILIGRDQ